MVSNARREALNSTGSVTSWKKVVTENKMMPAKNRDWLYISSPINSRMNENREPSCVAGMMAVRRRTGPYPTAYWTAWPASWAATPTAATVAAP